ncbi:MAG: SLBB domain-containing protein [Candidatus Cloacimonadales bacterium]
MRRFIIVIVLCLFSSMLAGQDAISSGINNASAYSFSGASGDKEQLKINAYIWGEVKSPGLYLVPDNTDILTLIALAGGPSDDARLQDIRIVRSYGEQEETISVDLESYLNSGDKGYNYTLKPGDTVIVRGTFYRKFKDFVKFMSEIGIILSVYITILKL